MPKYLAVRFYCDGGTPDTDVITAKDYESATAKFQPDFMLGELAIALTKTEAKVLMDAIEQYLKEVNK